MADDELTPKPADPAVSATAPGTRALRDPYLGRTLGGKYRILERLGQGGMGAVYKAEHTLVDRIVALKILHAHLVENENFLKRFHQEARVMSKMTHPNAVTLWDFGIEGDLPYLVLEFIHGKTLKDQISSTGAFSTGHTFQILRQVSAALAAAHALGIVHRDLKPDNVMITTDAEGNEHVRVLDFGIAKLLSNAGEPRSVVATQAGTLMGTPEYISPEQAMEKELDARADIYSLGVILYEMLSGRVPFTSTSPLEIYIQHIRNSPPPIPSIVPELNIPMPISAVVEKCLAKDPAQRFQTVGELVQAFEAALSAKPAVKPDQEELSPEATRKSFRAIGVVPPARDGARAMPRSYLFMGAAAAATAVLLGVFVRGGSGSGDEVVASQTENVDTVTVEHVAPEPVQPVLHAEARALSPGPETVVAHSIIPAEEQKVEAAPIEIAEESAPAEAVPPTIEAPVAEAAQPIVDDTAALTAELLQSSTEPVASRDDDGPDPDERVAAILAPLPEEATLRSLTPQKARAAAQKELKEGERLLDIKNYAEAGVHFRRALIAEERNLQARLNFGLVLMRLGRPAIAEMEFKQALALDPQYAPSHYSLASSYALGGKTDEALASLGTALKLFPGAKKWVADDKDFDPIRGDSRFIELTK